MEGKKRKKVSRHRGTHTHGRGAKKKARGKGHRGGIGKAGSGKRADQKKTKYVKKGKNYFGTSQRRNAAPKKEIPTITLQRIVTNISSFVKKGIATGKDGNYTLDLKAYKVIGNDAAQLKLHITALTASEGAKAAVKKAGGELTITHNDTETSVSVKAETTEKDDEEQ